MPLFSRKHFDQTNWDMADWLAARIWNVLFLIGWIICFGFAIVWTSRVVDKSMLILLVAIGIVFQLVNLRGIHRTIVVLRENSNSG